MTTYHRVATKGQWIKGKRRTDHLSAEQIERIEADAGFPGWRLAGVSKDGTEFYFRRDDEVRLGGYLLGADLSSTGKGWKMPEQVSLYLSYIDHTLLTSDEEKELARRIAEGDKGAAAQLVRQNLRLVVSIAKKKNARDDVLAELIQWGNMGLIRAAEKFDPDRGTKFSTYATPFIHGAIAEYFEEDNRQKNIEKRIKTVPARIMKSDIRLGPISASDLEAQKKPRATREMETRGILEDNDPVVYVDYTPWRIVAPESALKNITKDDKAWLRIAQKAKGAPNTSEALRQMGLGDESNRRKYYRRLRKFEDAGIKFEPV